MPETSFQTGNGITLCEGCHREVHAGFNGRPNLELPMDTQGGEKIEILAELYGTLLEDAKKRQLLCDDFYFISDSTLRAFKGFQGLDPGEQVAGFRLEQAYTIWNQCPRSMRDAILRANGFDFDLPAILPGAAAIVLE